MSTKWLFISWYLIVFPSIFSNAQLYQNERLELPIASVDEAYEVTSVGTYGIILYRKFSTYQENVFELTLVDTLLRKQWDGTFKIHKRYRLAQQVAHRQYLYFVYYPESPSDRNFLIIEVDLASGAYSEFNVRNIIPFIPLTVKATSQGALLGGYFYRTPVVLFFDFKNHRSKILPGLFNEPGEFSQIKINADESFDVLISAKNYQKQKTIWIKNYTPEGNLIRNVMITPKDENSLVFGRILQSNNDQQIVAGVYGSRNSEYSKGVFIAGIQNDGIQNIQYYNYAQLENFFSYMRDRQEKRVRDRIQRKKIKGKRIKLLYRVVIHEFIPYKDQFVLLGEAFYPQYRQIDRGYMAGAVRVSPLSTYVFDGYRYTHAVILGINNSGDLLWDNSFEINDIKTFTLDQFVKMDARDDKIALLYLYDNAIRTKVIQDSMVLEGKATNKLQMKSVQNTVTDDELPVNKLEYWYKRYFLASGVQTYMSKSTSGKKRKKVFFINKISFH